MKRARPPLPVQALAEPDALLTTSDAARVLRVHPKHVYRLLRQGLPGHRLGGEWRFLAAEILRWSAGRSPAQAERAGAPAPPNLPDAPPLLAANGDLAVERLLSRMKGEPGVAMGFVQADRGEGLELLRRGAVLVAGCHGGETPAVVGTERLAFIHLVERQVGLVLRQGVRPRSLRQFGRWRLASRPETAGVRAHLDDEARRQGVDPRELHANATVLGSHRDVVCAVARRDADVGLASEAWARQLGLQCIPLRRETYGLLVRASRLGDPRVVRLCEVAQSAAFRHELEDIAGYEARHAGVISYQSATTRDS